MDDDARIGQARPPRPDHSRGRRCSGPIRTGWRSRTSPSRIDVSVRTVYRDLNAIEGEIGIAFWSEGGTLGPGRGRVPAAAQVHARRGDGGGPVGAVDGPLRRQVRPRSRVGVREARRASCRPRSASTSTRTLDVLSRHPRDERFSRHVNLLTKAWAERRIVSLDYEPARYGPDSAPRTARVRPYLIEPSLQTHALYLDRVRRDARRDPDVQGRADPGPVAHARDRSTRPRRASSRACSTGPGTSSPTRNRSRSSSASRRTSRPASRRPAGIRRSRSRVEADGSLVWRATVAGTIEVRLWALAVGRRRRGPRAGLAAGRRRGDPPPGARAARLPRPAGLMARHPFSAVNLISDPIHGYVELTKRLGPAETAAAGLLPEDAAEEDLLDTAVGPAAAPDQPAPECPLGLPDRRAFAVHPRPRGHARGRAVGPGALPVARASALRGRRR